MSWIYIVQRRYYTHREYLCKVCKDLNRKSWVESLVSVEWIEKKKGGRYVYTEIQLGWDEMCIRLTNLKRKD